MYMDLHTEQIIDTMERNDVVFHVITRRMIIGPLCTPSKLIFDSHMLSIQINTANMVVLSVMSLLPFMPYGVFLLSYIRNLCVSICIYFTFNLSTLIGR